MKGFSPILFSICIIFSGFQEGFSQWERQYPVEKLELVLDLVLHGDGYGFGSGSNDLLLRLNPATETWDLLTNWNKGWRFKAIDYLESTSGQYVAAGGQGLIVSQNAGNTWMEIPGSPAGIHALKIISMGEILVSTDTGVHVWENDTWTNLNLPVSLNIGGAFILDRDHMWCYTIDSNPVIYYTSDGGDNWSVNMDIVRPTVIRFYNAQYGVALDGRKVYNSFNGGMTWNLVSTNAIANSSNDLGFGDRAAVMMAATFNAEPALSVDSGKTWTALNTFHINQRSYSIEAMSDSTFWMGNDISSVLLTADQGITWGETCGPQRNIFADAHFINRNTGFACGNKGLLLRTTDGGTHWEDISFGARNHLAVHGLTANDIWMGANQRIFHSQDTGTTWSEKLILSSSNINDVLAISGQRILAVSTTGIIYLSTDGGAVWDTVYNAGNQLRSVSRIDDLRYMATGFNGVILRSEDLGETWNMVTIPEPALQYEHSYFLGNEGWLVTSSFKKTMWHTTDAGDTWDPITLPIDRFWDGVYFITPDTGVVVCHTNAEGRAYITFNGGQNWQSGYVTAFPLYGVTGVPNPNGTAWIFGHASDIEVLPYCNALPVISDFEGDLFPCEADTIQYSVNAQNIDQFFWSFPSDWTIIGDPNQAVVQVKVGKNSGNISIVGTNVCGFSGQFSFSAGPIRLPALSNFMGDLAPCVGVVFEYSIQAENVELLRWSFPLGWTIFGDPEQETILVLVGPNAGTISIRGSNSCGVFEIMMDVDPYVIPPVSVIADENMLSLSETGASYQWFFNDMLIPGATSSTYTATESGFYFALVTFSDLCSTFSDTIEVTVISGLFNPLHTLPLRLYPVPVSHELIIDGVDGPFRYTLMDMTGKVLEENISTVNTLPMAHISEGFYVLMIKQDNHFYLGRFVVLN